VGEVRIHDSWLLSVHPLNIVSSAGTLGNLYLCCLCYVWRWFE